MCISGLSLYRDITRAVDSTSVAPQYRRGGSAVPSNLPECSESHELETLMPPGSQESIQPLAEAPEEQSLMARANPEEGEDGPAPETKVKTCGGGGEGSHLLFQMGQLFPYSLCSHWHQWNSFMHLYSSSCRWLGTAP